MFFTLSMLSSPGMSDMIADVSSKNSLAAHISGLSSGDFRAPPKSLNLPDSRHLG